MATLLFANNAQSNLAGPLTASAVTLNLTAGGGALFPVPGSGSYFKLTLADAATGLISEIMHVTAVSGDIFTVVRGQEGTTPENWLAGDFAANFITAGTMTAFAQTGSLPTSVYTANSDIGTANAVNSPTLVPPISAPAAGEIFVVTKSGSAGANTGATSMILGSSSSTAYSVVHNDGSALFPGEWPAGTTGFFFFNGGVYQVIGFGTNFLELIGNTTVINTATLNYINSTSAVGETHLFANAPGLVNSDIAVTPTNTTILTSGQFTGTSFIEGEISCAMRNTDTSGFFLGFACQVFCNDITAGIPGAFQSSYLGASATSTSSTQIQIPFSLAFKFQGLNPAKEYTLSIVARKAASYGPVQTYDGTINGYHSGVNS